MGYQWLKKQGVTDDDIKANIPYSEKQTKDGTLLPEVWSGDGEVRTAAQCLAWAESIDCTIRYPKNNELFIDIDNEESWHRFLILFNYFEKFFWGSRCTYTASKSGLPKRHIVVTLTQDYPLATRIGMQAVLGSDPMRELISFKRISQGDPENTIVCFFEPKAQQ